MPSGLYFCLFSNASIRLQDKQMVHRVLLGGTISRNSSYSKVRIQQPNSRPNPPESHIFLFHALLSLPPEFVQT